MRNPPGFFSVTRNLWAGEFSRLRRVLKAYLGYYNEVPMHLALSKDSAGPRATPPPGDGNIVAIPQLRGLHHRYEHRAD